MERPTKYSGCVLFVAPVRSRAVLREHGAPLTIDGRPRGFFRGSESEAVEGNLRDDGCRAFLGGTANAASTQAVSSKDELES